MKAIIKTELNCPANSAWLLVKQSETLIYVCKGLLSFKDQECFPLVWKEGEVIETALRFFGLIPAWRHSIQFKKISDQTMTMLTQERGGLVQHWNHEIKVEDKNNATCIYTDTVDIQAGFFTPVVWLFANMLYRYRQRRWKKLVGTAANT